jgi:hypothetical protein
LGGKKKAGSWKKEVDRVMAVLIRSHFCTAGLVFEN